MPDFRESAFQRPPGEGQAPGRVCGTDFHAVSSDKRFNRTVRFMNSVVPDVKQTTVRNREKLQKQPEKRKISGNQLSGEVTG
jgi:hypothetical protein